MKKLTGVNSYSGYHWVGNAFPVRTLLSYATHGPEISPFLLLDYAAPAMFPPSPSQRGVGMHPHRGFETVTIVYEGEIEHHDNAGNHGIIGPGEVQWMTAGKGVLHEEKHSRSFSETGGLLQMVQLWVNLPARDKMSPPRYQAITETMIPVVKLDDAGSSARIIAGTFKDALGPAQTFTPIHVWDLNIKPGHRHELKLPEGFATHMLVCKGSVVVNDGEMVESASLAFFEREGETISLKAMDEVSLLIMSGQPLNEPVVGQGPFVMNTHDEINQAMADFRAGLF